jgi:transposase
MGAFKRNVPLSHAEQAIVSRIRRAKLFICLRRIRHELFSTAFQEEWTTIFQDKPKGHPPVPPAHLALVPLLQAYTGASDEEAIAALLMDRRWQLVLDCLDCEAPPFSNATLVRFRTALIKPTLDRRLVERTIELATQSQGVAPRALRAALDSSPWWGAARVEDTENLLGHALRKALRVVARQQGRGVAAVATAARAEIVSASSLQAALDLDWDDPPARQQALGQVRAALDAVERWLTTQGEAAQAPRVVASMAAARQVQAQDVDAPPAGSPQLRRGVAPERRITIEDAEMRHGRKSRRQRIDGYKRQVLRDLESGVVRAVGVTPANVPEASVSESLMADLTAQAVTLRELHLDRAYLSSPLVRERPVGLEMFCTAWPVRNGTRFPQTAFVLAWEAGTRRCPNAVTMPFQAGGVVHFPAATCAVCPLQAPCTSSGRGRSLSIHPEERLLGELRAWQQAPECRAKLRERIAVEHPLAHVGRWQGGRARYRGQRKNLFDLRRSAVIHNLHVLARLPEAA